MSKKLNGATWGKIAAIVIVASLPVSPSAFAVPGIQGDVDSKIAEAVALFKDKQVQKAIAMFREVGDPAVPAVVNLLPTEIGSVPSVQLMLLSFIASAKGERSDAALLKLLSDKSPYVRGFAASRVGKRKLKVGVPELINLLSDTEPYLFKHVTHPYGYDREPSSIDVPIPVRDTAIDALQSITGRVIAKGKSREKQAEAWRQWWRKQKGSEMKPKAQ